VEGRKVGGRPQCKLLDLDKNACNEVSEVEGCKGEMLT